MVRAEGLEPSRAEAQRIFLPSTAFAARTQRFEARASGLRSGLSLHRSPEKPRLRCCPSSLYTFPVGLLNVATSWSTPSRLGSGLPSPPSPGTSLRFPRIWAVLHRRFPRRALKFLKSVASAGSATPARLVPRVFYHIGRRDVTSVWRWPYGTFKFSRKPFRHPGTDCGPSITSNRPLQCGDFVSRRLKCNREGVTLRHLECNPTKVELRRTGWETRDDGSICEPSMTVTGRRDGRTRNHGRVLRQHRYHRKYAVRL